MSREYKDLILWLIENTEPTYDGTFISNVELKEIILSDLKQYNDDKRLLNVLKKQFIKFILVKSK